MGFFLGVKSSPVVSPRDLGPLLFITYINDIYTSISSEGKIIIYPDDCTYLRAGECPDGLVDAVNNDFACLAKWYESNKLSLNQMKTKLMIFG